MILTDKITTLKGIGEKKKEAFLSHGIVTLEDLAWWFPRSYEDRREITSIDEAVPGRSVLICGTVISRRYSGNPYKKNSPVSFLITDGTARIEIVYFNGRYMSKALSLNEEYVFYGKVSENMGRLQMIHPESVRFGSTEDIRGIIPVYPIINGVSQKEIRKYIRQIRPLIDEIPEWLPESVVSEYRLASPSYALRNVHFPSTEHQILASRFRLVFDELMTLQAGLLYMKQGHTTGNRGVRIDPSPGAEFIRSLPFPLTSGQERAWKELAEDLSGDRPMNRLVQGDVGSGKTAIAEICMYAAVRNGYQAVMMAPTEILAKQHLQTLTKDFSPFGIKVDLLCGSMRASEKKSVLDRLASGETGILVGTHAVIRDDVRFSGLGLVITDEQHRFGVEQRYLLSQKGEGPNVMVMTATPIPRTLAVILYGELDISVIDSMPEGRKPVRTISVSGDERSLVYRKVKEEISAGHQAYVVCPLIEESDKIEARSAEEVYQELCRKMKGLRIGLIHGSLGQEEKDQVMEQFVLGELDILVSTVVIEIGINVANATVMVIENCERFGLAQMHQLRGRVGRGSDLSYCYLILQNDTEIASERVRIMCENSDGFQIAEMDLQLRGPGELFGTRQHGLPEMHISDIVRHADVLEKARSAAASVLAEDPGLEQTKHQELRRRVEKMFGEDIRLKL